MQIYHEEGLWGHHNKWEENLEHKAIKFYKGRWMMTTALKVFLVFSKEFEMSQSDDIKVFVHDT